MTIELKNPPDSLTEEFARIYLRLSPLHQLHISRLVRLLSLPNRDTSDKVDWVAVRARVAGLGAVYGVDVAHELAMSDDALNETSALNHFHALVPLDWLLGGDTEALLRQSRAENGLEIRNS